jgi:MFS family permease
MASGRDERRSPVAPPTAKPSTGTPPGPLPGPARRRAASYGLALSLAALTAASFAAVGFSANAPFIRDSFGLSHAGIGAIASAVYGTASATSVVGGRLTDRTGPGPVLVLSMLALGLGVAIAAVAPGAVVFFAGVLVCGLGYGLVNPPTNVLANPRSARRRGLAMSVKQSGIPLGGIVAGASLPPVAAVAGWRWAMAAPVAVCALLAFASVTTGGRGGAKATLHRDEQPPDVVLRRFPGHAFGFLMAGVQVTIFTFLTVYLTEDRHLSAGRAGSMLALLMVGGLVGRLVWGWVSDRRPGDRVRVLQAISLLSGAALVLVPALGTAMLAGAALVVGCCAVGWNGVYIATVSESAPPETIGVTTGVALLLVNLGAVVLPPAFGALVGVAGWQGGWYLCAALSLLALGVLQVSRASGAGSGAGG